MGFSTLLVTDHFHNSPVCAPRLAATAAVTRHSESEATFTTTTSGIRFSWHAAAKIDLNDFHASSATFRSGEWHRVKGTRELATGEPPVQLGQCLVRHDLEAGVSKQEWSVAPCSGQRFVMVNCQVLVTVAPALSVPVATAT
jgi:hypothetical protein